MWLYRSSLHNLCLYFIAGFNSLPRSLTNTSDEYSTSLDSSTPIDNSSVLETLLEDQEVTLKSKKYFYLSN